MHKTLRLALLPALLAVAGCGGQKSYDGTIAISVLTTTNPFFVDIADTVKAEAARHNFDVLVTSGDNDVAKQKKQVEDFIGRQVDAIILCPCDSKSIGTAIEAANEAGIPVFTADIACLAEGPKVVCHVASDNEGGGREAAKALSEALGGTGKVAILDYPEVESVIMRTTGFRDELRNHPGIEIVTAISGGGDKKKGRDATDALLQAHPELDGIFAINDPSGLGAAAAIGQANRTGEVKIVSFDAQPEGRQAVKDGKFYATITQDPVEIGRKAVEVVMRYLDGRQVEKEILIPCEIYRKADADKDPILKQVAERQGGR
jgi:ribose transport system substrate-binding protein